MTHGASCPHLIGLSLARLFIAVCAQEMTANGEKRLRRRQRRLRRNTCRKSRSSCAISSPDWPSSAERSSRGPAGGLDPQCRDCRSAGDAVIVWSTTAYGLILSGWLMASSTRLLAHSPTRPYSSSPRPKAALCRWPLQARETNEIPRPPQADGLEE